MRKRTILSTSALLGLAASLGSPAAAQEWEPGWRFVPRVGTHFIDTNNAIVLKGGTRRFASLEQEMVLGIGFDFDTPLWWLGFRVSADRTMGAEASFTRPCAEGCPSEVERVRVGAEVEAYALDARIQPAPRSWAARPFVHAGFGWLDVDVEEEDVVADRPLTRHFGWGIDLDIPHAPLRIETIRRFFEQEDSPRHDESQWILVFGARILVE